MLAPAKARPSVLVVGSVNSDLVLRASHFPAPGESLIAKDCFRVAGGKGANQAVAAVRLGARATFVGRIGNDSEGMALKAGLHNEGVGTDFLRSCPVQTGLAVITIDGQGQNAIVVVPGANNEVTEEDVHAALFADKGSYDALMLQLEIPAETVIATCGLAEARGIPVILDPGPAQVFPLERLRGVHLITPNETEVFALTGIKLETEGDAETAAAILLHHSNAKAVVLKLGARGALICEGHGACEHLPAYRVETVDTTAAGDAFTAAMTLEYIRTGDLRRAVMWGNAAGALATMSFGAQPSLPTVQALQDFCTSHGGAYAA
jgi:ribokinase